MPTKNGEVKSIADTPMTGTPGAPPSSGAARTAPMGGVIEQADAVIPRASSRATSACRPGRARPRRRPMTLLRAGSRTGKTGESGRWFQTLGKNGRLSQYSVREGAWLGITGAGAGRAAGGDRLAEPGRRRGAHRRVQIGRAHV